MDIAFIGFGEAAQALIDGWAADRLAVLRAFDIKTDDSAPRAAKHADYRHHAVAGTDSLAEAVADADLILSLVIADQSLAAAKTAAPLLRPGALYCDTNSVAPATKRVAVRAVEAAGAASAIKMIRSIMIKGLEALTAECLLSARAAGVDEEVIASLDASFLGFDWRARGDYNLDRMLVHGRRAAGEARGRRDGARPGAGRHDGRRHHRLAAAPGRSRSFPLPGGPATKADAILHATGRTSA